MNGLTVEEMEFLAAKGLSIGDIIEFAKLARQPKPRSANAERQARFRERRKGGGVTEGVTRNVTGNALPSPEVSPNDIYSNPLPNPTEGGAAAPDRLAERVIEAWNAGPKANGATGSKSMNDARRKALRARVREHGEQAIFEAIEHIAASPFHCGKNDRGWSADLGWLLESPKNFLKALEMEPAGKRASPANDLVSQAARYAKYRTAPG